MKSALIGGLACGLFVVAIAHTSVQTQTPPAQTPTPTPAAPGGQRGGRGPGRPAVMSLTTTAWADGGAVPVKFTQAGPEVSPPLAWSNVPDGVASFVLMVTDMDAVNANGTEPLLHWLVWNIPGTARSLPEAVPQGAQLPDGMRQISGTGPNYRGPGAPASGPAHHYAFELFALATAIDVPPVGASPGATRTAVLAAMASQVRAKATLIGLYKR